MTNAYSIPRKCIAARSSLPPWLQKLGLSGAKSGAASPRDETPSPDCGDREDAVPAPRAAKLHQPRGLRARQQPLGFRDMRAVVHHAFNTDDACAWTRRECRNDRLRLGDCCGRRGEYLV